MQVFELYFNPPIKSSRGREEKNEKDGVFESFCYTPENVYEKKLGSIYIAGEIQNVLPQNFKFLERISKVVKEKYYGNFLKLPEGALKESLKALNDFLAEELKKDNTSWLGNLNLTIISLTPQEQPWVELNFTKIGNMKIFLLKDGQVSDIGSKLQQEIEPYPLKVFSNIVSGKIADDNIVAVLTQEASEFFQNRNLLKKIAQQKDLDDKKIKEVLRPEENDLSKISGVCLVIQLMSEAEPKSVLAFREKLAHFPLPKIKNYFAKIGALKTPKLIAPTLKIKIPKINKNFILILLLISVLMVGFFAAQGEKKKNAAIDQNTLKSVESEISQAQNFLRLEDYESASELFQKALEEVLPLTKKNAPLAKEAAVVKKTIEESLNKINKLEKIETPEVIFEFNNENGIIPYKMVLSGSKVYFYNPFSPNIYKLDIEKREGRIIEGDKNIQSGALYSDSVLFFAKPNFKISLDEAKNKLEAAVFELPDFSDAASFSNFIYFLDSKTGEIIRYSPSAKQSARWLNRETKKAISAKSIAVDGSVWILTNENLLDRYRMGNLQESFKINIFPPLQSPAKIWTNVSTPYLYILDPSQNRIIILTKTGKIVNQYQSENFDELLDFAVSPGGKTIYILNAKKLYRLF